MIFSPWICFREPWTRPNTERALSDPIPHSGHSFTHKRHTTARPQFPAQRASSFTAGLSLPSTPRPSLLTISHLRSHLKRTSGRSGHRLDLQHHHSTSPPPWSTCCRRPSLPLQHHRLKWSLTVSTFPLHSFSVRLYSRIVLWSFSCSCSSEDDVLVLHLANQIQEDRKKNCRFHVSEYVCVSQF